MKQLIAVLALVAVYERLGERWRIWMTSAGFARGVGGYLAATALSSVIATLATAPFAAFHFNRVAEYGVLSNLIAVPLMAFWVMPCGFLALLLMPFGLEALPLQAMGWGIAMILSTADTIDSVLKIGTKSFCFRLNSSIKPLSNSTPLKSGMGTCLSSYS